MARRALLDWYEPRRRMYPWRRTSDPYAILVSEVMLQQTQAPRVVPAFERFVGRFPTVGDLAAASLADVIRCWDGLGYNRRAVSLHRAARTIERERGGVVPGDVTLLLELRGVGAYTAAAVASIAFGAPVAAVDTNVRRVVGRVLGGSDDLDAAATARLAASFLDKHHPGDWNQAVMDLGRVFCRPAPRCGTCPLRDVCAFARRGRPGLARRRSPNGSAPFAGSMREVRGAVVRELGARGPSTIAMLATRTGHAMERISTAVVGLERDGLVEAGPRALRGAPRGRVRLAR